MAESETPTTRAQEVPVSSRHDGNAQAEHVPVETAKAHRDVTLPLGADAQATAGQSTGLAVEPPASLVDAAKAIGTGWLVDKAREFLQPSPTIYDINDQRFIKELEELKRLRSFFIEEAVPLKDTRALSFGELNLLRFSRKGRSPKTDEWAKIEEFTSILFSSLTDVLRRKYRVAAIPWILAELPVGLIIFAFASVILATWASDRPILGFENTGMNVLPFYLIWLLSLGAIGAVAFIGMNALSVQEDITFDLTNRRLMMLRIVLGGLFGLLTLPFGFQDFYNFCSNVSTSTPNAAGEPPGNIPQQAVTLLMPFVLGFSTSLVILVLNQLIDGIQAFFGKRTAASTTPKTNELIPADRGTKT